MAIKSSLGKLKLPAPFDSFILTQMELNTVALLSLSIPQIALVAAMPFHHRDPFDRILIAQAVSDGLPIISRDAFFDAYAVKRLW